LQLEDGRYIRLSDLHGTPVVINFWATWCGPCRIEMPELMRSVAADPGLLLLAVNLREPLTAVEPFAQSFEMVTPVVLDSEGKVADQFGVRGLPTTVFVDAEGRIQAIHAGIVTPAALADYLEKIVADEEPL
jgi:thiol-disulfide isomerase/thioredoxin